MDQALVLGLSGFGVWIGVSLFGDGVGEFGVDLGDYSFSVVCGLGFVQKGF